MSHVHGLCRYVPQALACLIAFSSCSGPAHGPEVHAQVADVSAQVVHAHATVHETCFICDPEKRDPGRLWCGEHGRYEDRCWLCHPELEDKHRLYCTEHFLYEDECILCRPAVEQAALSGVTEALFCNEHQVFEMECGICQPQLATALAPGKHLFIRMPSAASADKAGIRTEYPRQRGISPEVQVFCEVQYNQNAMAKMTPLLGGIVSRVYVDAGDRVRAGDLLVALHAAEAATAKSAYLSALVVLDIRRGARDRERALVAESISAHKDYQQAEADFRMAMLDMQHARQRLLNLGFDAEAIAGIEQKEDASAVIEIRAPFGGTVIHRNAVIGQAVEPGQSLFELADLSSFWLMLSVPSDQMSDIQIGQFVEAQFDGLAGDVVRGHLAWIDTAVDERTRMVRVRGVATQGIDRVKAGMFGRAKIVVQDRRSGLVIPRDAVQVHAQQSFAFVKYRPDLYALRRIRVGAKSEDAVEVLAGLQPDDAVVTASGFLVMSEFLKFRLGAGCVD